MIRSRSKSLPLGVDLDGAISVVAAELASDGAFTVRDAYTSAFRTIDADAIDRSTAEALRALITRVGARERRCVLAAPPGEVAMRVFRIPPGMRRAEAERAAALEADSVSSLPASERLVALDPLPGRIDEMLISVARNSTIERLVAIPKAAGLRPVAVDIPLCAWRRAIPRADAVFDYRSDRAALTIFGDPIGTTHTYPPRLIEERLFAQIRGAFVDARREGLADVQRLAILAPPDRYEAAAETLAPDGYTLTPVVLGETTAPSWALAYGLASWAVAPRGIVAA